MHGISHRVGRLNKSIKGEDLLVGCLGQKFFCNPQEFDEGLCCPKRLQSVDGLESLNFMAFVFSRCSGDAGPGMTRRRNWKYTHVVDQVRPKAAEGTTWLVAQSKTGHATHRPYSHVQRKLSVPALRDVLTTFRSSHMNRLSLSARRFSQSVMQNGLVDRFTIVTVSKSPNTPLRTQVL